MPVVKQKLRKPDQKAEGTELFRASMPPETIALIKAKADDRGVTPAKLIINAIEFEESFARRFEDAMSLMEEHNANMQKIMDRVTATQDFIAKLYWTDAQERDDDVREERQVIENAPSIAF